MQCRALLGLVLMMAVGGCSTTLSVDDPSRPGQIHFRIGPIDVPRAGGVAQAQFANALYRMADSGWITSFQPSIEDEAGHALAGPMLHHMILAGYEQHDFLCPNIGWNGRLMLAAGGELSTIALPDGDGIAAGGGDLLIAQVMLMGAPDRAFERVYFAANLGYVTERSGETRKPLTPVFVDVSPDCPKEGYEVAPWHKDAKARTFRFPFAGTLVFAAAHLHDRAVSLSLRRAAAGAPSLQFVPTLDAAGTIAAIAPQRPDPPLSIDTTTDYVLEALYDNQADQALMAMAILVAFIAPAAP